jgi:Plavaka transposase
MRCTRCDRKFRDRKSLLCHMNHPFGACYSHFQEIADLADDLQRYKDRPTQSEDENLNNMQPMDLGADSDMDVDASFTEHDNFESVAAGGSDWGMDGGVFVEEYEGAAKEYGTGTTFMDEFDRDQYAGERINNLYYPFASRNEWELAAFLLRSDLSMASIDSFLSLNLVRVSFATHTYNYLCSAQVKGLNLSFGTAKRLRGLAEMLPKGPVWQCKVWNTVYPTKKKLTLFYRDPLKCIQSILHSPLMKDYIKFKPLRIFESASRAMRIYTEWLTGNAAWSHSCRANYLMGQLSLELSYRLTRPIYLR